MILKTVTKIEYKTLVCWGSIHEKFCCVLCA